MIASKTLISLQIPKCNRPIRYLIKSSEHIREPNISIKRGQNHLNRTWEKVYSIRDRQDDNKICNSLCKLSIKVKIHTMQHAKRTQKVKSMNKLCVNGIRWNQIRFWVDAGWSFDEKTRRWQMIASSYDHSKSINGHKTVISAKNQIVNCQRSIHPKHIDANQNACKNTNSTKLINDTFLAKIRQIILKTNLIWNYIALSFRKAIVLRINM